MSSNKQNNIYFGPTFTILTKMYSEWNSFFLNINFSDENLKTEQKNQA